MAQNRKRNPARYYAWMLDLAARFVKQELRNDAYKNRAWKIQPLLFYGIASIFAQSPHTSVRIACLHTRRSVMQFRELEACRKPEELVGQARFVLTDGYIMDRKEVPRGWQLLVARDRDTIELPFPYYSIWESPFVFRKRDRELEIDLLWFYEAKKGSGLLPEYSDAPVKFLHAEKRIRDEELYLSTVALYRKYYMEAYGEPGTHLEEHADILDRLAEYDLQAQRELEAQRGLEERDDADT